MDAIPTDVAADLGAGRFAEAEPGLRRALMQDPANTGLLTALGLALRAQGRLDEAAASLEAALARAPDSADALRELALVRRAQGRLGLAFDSQARLTALTPDDPAAWFNLGTLLRAGGRLDQAAEAYGRAARLAPEMAEAHLNLGRVLQAQERLAAAAQAYARALALRPDYAAAHVNLGTVRQTLGDPAGALACYDQALAVDPGLAAAHDNRGLALQELGDLDGAAASHGRAAALQPDTPESHNNLGIALYDRGDAAGALASFRRAVACRPDHADAQYNMAKPLLQLGDLEAGFRAFEWRWRCPAFRRAHAPPWHDALPAWTGDDLGGRTLLLHAEQGYGDSLQFWRFVPALQARGGRVAAMMPAALVRLLAAQGHADQVVAADAERPPAECRAALMSLPHLLGTTWATLPSAPYLGADPDLAATWRRRLGPGRRVGLARVGLVWASGLRPFDNRLQAEQQRRSVPFAALAPLLALPGIDWVSLQLGAPAADARGHGAVLDLSSEIADFADTAAVIAGLDLVITVDTAVAHVAGALGRPVWVLLPHVTCWRWLRDRRDSPWYPSARLYRQPAPGDWASVVAAVRADLLDGSG